jgi:hypothetical protein
MLIFGVGVDLLLLSRRGKQNTELGERMEQSDALQGV